MKCETVHLKDYVPALQQNGCDPLLAVYLPDNLSEMQRQDQKRPCLLICPGGGYSFCSQREAEPVALYFLPEGLNVFVLYYSVAPHRFPTQLREVAAVTELIAQKSDEWNCDSARVAIMGFSAGGHLAAHYSTAYDCPEVRSLFPHSRPVQASILGYPVITADPRWGHMRTFTNLTGKEERTAEEIESFSCDRLVTDKTPPAFLWHTATDGSVPVNNSLLYAQALAEKNVPFELHIYPRGAHGLSTCDEQTYDTLLPEHTCAHAWLQDAKRWLKLTLNGMEA